MSQYREAAEGGDPEAQHQLGDSYHFGKNGVSRDLEEAVKWYRKAAKQGHATAQRDLAFCYWLGRGVSKDLTAAVKWCRKSAEQGNEFGQNALAVCYQNGWGVTKDPSEAVKWCRKSAEQGNADAQYALGCWHEFGRGVRINENEASGWYRKAADQGMHYPLGYCFEKGVGVPINPNEAFACYQRASENRDKNDAPYKVGWCYENGFGIEKDINKAINWYRKAAEEDQTFAQRRLGFCYENGYGVTKDLTEATKWYHKAADRGDEDAKSQLAKVEAELELQREQQQGQKPQEDERKRQEEARLQREKQRQEEERWRQEAPRQREQLLLQQEDEQRRLELERLRKEKEKLEAEKRYLDQKRKEEDLQRIRDEVEQEKQKIALEKSQSRPSSQPSTPLSNRSSTRTGYFDSDFSQGGTNAGTMSPGISIVGSGSVRQNQMYLGTHSRNSSRSDSITSSKSTEFQNSATDDAFKVVYPSDLKRGSRIDRFELQERPKGRVDNGFARVKDTTNGTLYAFKIFTKSDQYECELKHLTLFQQNNACFAPALVHFGEIKGVRNKAHFIVSELLGKNVVEYFGPNEPPDDRWTHAFTIIREMLKSMKGIHDLGKVHGDVKPSHFLCSRELPLKVKLIDFDNCHAFGDPMDRGTESSYLAPEILRQFQSGVPNRASSAAGDMWAVGLTIYEIIMGVSLMKETYRNDHHGIDDIDDDDDAVTQYWKMKVMSTSELDLPFLRENTAKFDQSGTIACFVSEILKKDPKQRLSAEKALDHRLFKVGDPTKQSDDRNTLILSMLKNGFANLQTSIDKINERLKILVDRVNHLSHALSQLNDKIDENHMELAEDFLQIRLTLFHVNFAPAVPRTFFIIPKSDPKSWGVKLLGFGKRLHFMCEKCSWYDSSPNGGYKITDPKKFVRNAAPFVALGLKIVQSAASAIPIIGNAVNGLIGVADGVADGIHQIVNMCSGITIDESAAPTFEKLTKRQVENFPILINVLQEYYDDDAKAIANGNTEKYTEIVNSKSKLEQLKAFLKSVDIKKEYGGLDVVQTKDGAFVWCCRDCKNASAKDGAVHF